jgi:hypothetical protein
MGGFGDLANGKDTKEDIKISRKQSRYQDIKISDKEASKPAVDDDSFAEKVRRVVKEVGKETSPLRVTPYENDLLEDVIHTLKRAHNIRTDKTQIVRVLLNYGLNDFLENKKTSILVQCLERLNA